MFATDISKQLEAYEVEYHVLQEEMTSLHTGSYDNVDASDRIARLQVANDGLRRQKMELLEQLQVPGQKGYSPFKFREDGSVKTRRKEEEEEEKTMKRTVMRSRMMIRRRRRIILRRIMRSRRWMKMMTMITM